MVIWEEKRENRFHFIWMSMGYTGRCYLEVEVLLFSLLTYSEHSTGKMNVNFSKTFVVYLLTAS